MAVLAEVLAAVGRRKLANSGSILGLNRDGFRGGKRDFTAEGTGEQRESQKK
jgi:hypothetical protein